MPATHAEYACDGCRSRKVACSRTLPTCHRCDTENLNCTYSRSGIIRRDRKRKRDSSSILSADDVYPKPNVRTPGLNSSYSPLASEIRFSQLGGGATHLESALATDIDTTRDQLTGIAGSDNGSLGALSTLANACATIWHDSVDFKTLRKQFFLFRERMSEWTDVFANMISRAQPLLIAPPAEVLQCLRKGQVDQVAEKAWLLLFYSIVLSSVSSKTPDDHDTKKKLRANIWLTLHDARLLLEPSEINIQALIMLASHVEEFSTPSLCWMLTTNACRMLQALGVNHRRLSSETRERRRLMFWHLNLVDTGLALCFGRPPTFHRAMSKEIEVPSLTQLRNFQPHKDKSHATSLFGAHYIHQMFLCSRVVGDIWHCLYDGDPPDDDRIRSTIRAMEAWYMRALGLLKAAATAEKPFLDNESIAAIDLGLRMVEYQREYFLVLLCRQSPNMRDQCFDSSISMLHHLPGIVSDSEESFNGIVWQLVCCPFTPFLLLFSAIVAGNSRSSIFLMAMENLPSFLREMSVRNSLASKLQSISEVIMQHARSVVASRANANLSQEHSAQVPTFDPRKSTAGLQGSDGRELPWDAFLGSAFPNTFPPNGAAAQESDIGSWDVDFVGDIDWIGLDGLF